MATDDFNKPNIVLPMASSYNERGAEGYTSTITNAADQRRVNCLYEMAGNQLYLKKRPGFLDIGQTLGASASDVPLYALEDISAEAQPWVFTSTSIGANRVHQFGVGTTTIASSSAGSYISFVDTVLISGARNHVAQITVRGATPQAVTQRIFFSPGPSTSWTEISASAITAENVTHGKMEQVDGWSMLLTAENKIINSNLNSLSTWSSTNFISKQIKTDFPIGLARLGSTILAFGYETVEGFYNAGNTVGSPLSRRTEIATNIGLGMSRVPGFLGNNSGVGLRAYYCTVGKIMYFIGAVAGGAGQLGIFAFDGQTFSRVSTNAIDRILAGSTTQSSDYYAESIHKMSFQGREAVAVSLSWATTSPQRWLMFFPDVKEWFEWTSSVFQPVGTVRYFIGTKGTYSNRIFTQDLDSALDKRYLDDSAVAIEMIHQFKLPKQSNARAQMAWAGVVADSISASTSTTANGEANLYISFSDNDYQSFSTPRVIDLTQRKKQIYRCGSYEDRAVRLVHSGNAECRIQAFIAKTM